MIEKHTHKLKKVIYKSGNSSFFCVLPDCTFKINPVLALGKKTICWRCEKEFQLDEYKLRLVKPHCESCHRPKKVKGEKISLGQEWISKVTSADAPESPSIIGAPMSLAERLRLAEENAKNAAKQQEAEEDI